ncbi:MULTISPECIES: hypothetical protein [Halococcus]|uniref:Uncharacterized protein n=1 Tax=Halococcus salifodinae DSM 8989 TaxID=1227456 RepID=M0MTV9_9EURY|nr:MULTISPECIES: hypothetical protein [Halococcus]EMA49172.1 hypothetical protein C450_17953 [Halococcus salifodinae DSM 8989]
MEFTEKLLGDGETTTNRTTDEGTASRERTDGTGTARDDSAGTTESPTNDAARSDTFAFRDSGGAADSVETATKDDSEHRNDDGPRDDVAADLGTEDSGRAKRGKPGRNDGTSAPQDDVAADIGVDGAAVAGADTTADAQRTGAADASSGTAETGANDVSSGETGGDSETATATSAPASDGSDPEPDGATDDRTRAATGSTDEDVAAPMDGRILHIAAAQSITVTDERAVRIDGARDVSLVAEPETDPQNEHAPETAATVGSRT